MGKDMEKDLILRGGSLTERDESILEMLEKALPNMTERQKTLLEGLSVAVSMMSKPKTG